MILSRFLIFISILAICLGNSLAFVDKEINESRKCSAIFSYFEKRFNIPKDLLHSISLRESAKKHSNSNLVIVWPWTVNVGGQGYYFNNKRDAVKFTKNQLASGATNIDVGCMQINLKYHPNAFTSLEQAFSPRSNVAYGAKFLSEKYIQHGDWISAVGNYHSADPARGRKYRQRVGQIGSNMATYKKNLRKALYSSNKSTTSKNITTNSKTTSYKKKSGRQVQVRVGRINNDNWYRKVKK